MSEPTELMILGSMAKSLIDNMRFDETLESVLNTYTPELLTLGDMEWYPVSKMLVALEKLVEVRNSYDATFDMVAIGMAAAQRAPVPEGLTFEDFLNGVQGLMEQVYDGPGKGYANSQKLGDKNYRVEFDMPWPDDLMYGNYYGLAKRLLPSRSRFTVTKTSTRKPTVFTIQWT